MKTTLPTNRLSYQSKEPAIKIGDVGIGLAAAVVTFLLSAATPGSFNFFTPWVFWSVVVLFLAGAIRPSQPNENIWIKAVATNSVWFLLIFPLLASGNDLWWVIVITAGTIVPTIAGIFTRRRFATLQK